MPYPTQDAWIDRDSGAGYDPQREPVEVIERNGNLTLVEDSQGETHWLAPFEFA